MYAIHSGNMEFTKKKCNGKKSNFHRQGSIELGMDIIA